ncbi:hypothetical protein B0I35DRAFT_186690 [Stachybotrys elegans]|uniref:Uncharacterized protein n=1 Tax=Stachybotrys elegans TaxID=80388 RepID=A0A8K0SRN3_9HYPO|nr:hypothetical protein B0I35DRAFT_186690 [Stachybotrys elegans]
MGVEEYWSPIFSWWLLAVGPRCSGHLGPLASSHHERPAVSDDECPAVSCRGLGHGSKGEYFTSQPCWLITN